ncbi:peptide/nickel transport system permease protein [Clostridium collagenovorans DSM 3089]|uniref:Peptide/nickel transport system permease protein n=1 Tax=Clostridium collagenovorans DSM 3089 TaxID=1121306 RepID=A0A1M5VYB1_9CLOT|nr:ABC transporter permease [Clostridium collagenovorans]SHH80160.1 peptide/nickel transport system permease protein [Clostridium collagenovorans DSM 3089]
MKKQILKRILQAIPMLFFISFISFMLMNLAPGDPAKNYITPKMSQEQITIIRENLGLNKPILVRYGYWLKNTLSGELGYSLVTNQPVSSEIVSRLPATFGLMGISLLFSVIVALPLGLFTALHKGKFIDDFVTILNYVGISIPSFWFAMILITIFSLKLGWLPSVGMRSIGVDTTLDLISHGILPTLVLSLSNISVLTRYVRSSALVALQEDYIITAKSKGLSEKQVLFNHVLKNSLLPIITILGMNLTAIVSGAFITETVFGWPGMGRLGMNAILAMDYPIIMAITMLSSIFVVLGNLLADILNYFVDPRIKVGE